MFGNFVQRIQDSFSPVTSPVSSPKVLRRRFKSPNRGPAPTRAAQPPTCRHRGSNSRRNHKEEYREVQSEPELDNSNSSSTGSRRLLDKRKGKTRPKILNISDPIPIDATKFPSDGSGLALYCSANDITALTGAAKYLQSDAKPFTKSHQYGTGKSSESIYMPRPEKSHLKEINQNGFVYVNGVPNGVDESLYENHSALVRDDKISRKENVCDVVGNRKNSRLQEFRRTNRQDHLYAGLGFAPLQGSKSLGRLDGIKERFHVSNERHEVILIPTLEALVALPVLVILGD
ncbi:hypothetical protein RUM43_002262 [Polyplax serrata]|uniref:Uncharacterized protein n=1 Tax=Polyplax serrata TaxID=468196 RepID=A0AAN8RVT0_POLSC